MHGRGGLEALYSDGVSESELTGASLTHFLGAASPQACAGGVYLFPHGSTYRCLATIVAGPRSSDALGFTSTHTVGDHTAGPPRRSPRSGNSVRVAGPRSSTTKLPLSAVLESHIAVTTTSICELPRPLPIGLPCVFFRLAGSHYTTSRPLSLVPIGS